MILFYLSIYCGRQLSGYSQFIGKIGETIFTKKMNQYNNSGFFGPLRNAIKQDSFLKGMLFILPLIILKSVTFYIISILLITPIILIFQGVTMGSLFIYHKKQNQDEKALVNITFWQLFSHLVAGTYGFIKGIDWMFNIDLITTSRRLLFFNIEFYVLLSFLSAVIAAYFEVKSLIEMK